MLYFSFASFVNQRLMLVISTIAVERNDGHSWPKSYYLKCACSFFLVQIHVSTREMSIDISSVTSFLAFIYATANVHDDFNSAALYLDVFNDSTMKRAQSCDGNCKILHEVTSCNDDDIMMI